MFITAPGLVQHLHPSQVAPRQTHWPAITLSMARPWYLLVYDVSYNGQKVSQTCLVAWDNTLLEILAQIPMADLSGIARLDRRRWPEPRWALGCCTRRTLTEDGLRRMKFRAQLTRDINCTRICIPRSVRASPPHPPHALQRRHPGARAMA